MGERERARERARRDGRACGIEERLISWYPASTLEDI